MKKSILIITVLITQQIKSQTLIGINLDLGGSQIINKNQNNVNSTKKSSSIAFGIGTDFSFNISKQFNPKINIGFTQKNSTEVQTISFFVVDSLGKPINFSFYDKIITNTKINGFHLDLGIRFNIINKKYKLFIEFSISNNVILNIREYKWLANSVIINSKFNIKPTTVYYTSIPMGIGYGFKNIFSVAFIYNPALTYFDSQKQSRVNMYGLNLCYYLPILGNKKVKAEIAK